jgi:tRNA1Val (adenine37-N6)-methyltransferase
MTTVTKINDNLSLIQNPDGLTFGTDAYLLSAFVKGGKKLTGADLGSGTGIIPLLCAAKEKAAKIYAVEIQKDFAALIEKNAELNSLTDKIAPVCADVRELKSVDIGHELDFVTANPPYMKVDSGKRNEHDEKFIARHEVCGDINDFCSCASRLLKHGGKFYTVWRPDRLVDLISSLRANRLEPKVITFVCATPESEPSIVLIRSTKGAASGAVVTRNLFLHENKEDAQKSILSADAARIYESCSFEEFK